MHGPASPEDEARRGNLYSPAVPDSAQEARFDRVTRIAQRLFNVPVAMISLMGEHRQWYQSSIGLAVSETTGDISLYSHTILDSQPLVVPDTSLDPRFKDNPLLLGVPDMRFYAGCPLAHPDGTTVGTLCIIDTQPRHLGPEDLAALVDLAALAERELNITRLAMMDELTNIANRRGFIKLAQSTLDLCRRKNIAASLAFLDLDKLKPINDNLGHAAGDRILRDFAQLTQQCLRSSDVLGRLGGDEFAILMTGTTIEDSTRVISSIRQGVESYNKSSERIYPLGFSAGVVAVELNKKCSVELLLNQADTLMYRNKKPGNTVNPDSSTPAGPC